MKPPLIIRCSNDIAKIFNIRPLETRGSRLAICSDTDIFVWIRQGFDTPGLNFAWRIIEDLDDGPGDIRRKPKNGMARQI